MANDVECAVNVEVQGEHQFRDNGKNDGQHQIPGHLVIKVAFLSAWFPVGIQRQHGDDDVLADSLKWG